MEEKVKLIQKADRGLVLRSIEEKDLENLRNWKNDNRKAFFYQEIITPQQQREWFLSYLKDPDNTMFVVEYENRPVGCLGYKLQEGTPDIYNVILSDPEFKRRGIMSNALKMMDSYLYRIGYREVTLKVIKSNIEAINFYKKNGYEILKDEETYYLMGLSLDGKYIKEASVLIVH